ncbi:Serine/threonine-protein kinase PknD [Streptomyces microflavus]
MSTQCQRPACEGADEDMGGGELYCDTCGLAPVVSPTGMVSSPPTGIAGGGRASSRDSSSQRSSSGLRALLVAFVTSRRSVSGRLSRSLSGSSTSRSVSVRSSGSSAASSTRGRLGVGLVQVPDVPRPDPRTAVMENPEVPERKRFCSRSDCGAPVGRSRGERPGRTEGFCTKCGHPYSFVPKLTGGDIVHGQYEVVGCLAHGGLGWVYLAVDRAVSDRWVVLKGLLDTGDQDAMAAAISERRFLAEIEHANIVRIYNFVEHLDQRTGSLDGYIVMEYVGGKALKEIANERRTPAGKRDPLPVEQACAYGIEALEALGHLHSRNLLYCDFKVDNAIQTEDPGGACRSPDAARPRRRTAPGGPARTRRARASRGGRPVARRIGDGQLRRARARAPGDGPARHGLGRQAVADDASGAPRRPGGGGSGRHGTRRRARRTPLQSRQLQQPRQLGRLRSGRARSPHGGAHPDARRQYEGLRGLPVRPGGPRRILRELRARPAPRARPHGAGARLGGRRQRPGPAPPP